MCLCDAKIESREGKNEKKKKKNKTNVEAGTVSAYRDKARAEPFI